MHHPNIWGAMSTVGGTDDNISAQIGSNQQLVGAQGSFFHGFDGFYRFSQEDCILMVFHGFHGFYGFSWFSWIFMDFQGFPLSHKAPSTNELLRHTRTYRFHAPEHVRHATNSDRVLKQKTKHLSKQTPQQSIGAYQSRRRKEPLF